MSHFSRLGVRKWLAVKSSGWPAAGAAGEKVRLRVSTSAWASAAAAAVSTSLRSTYQGSAPAVAGGVERGHAQVIAALFQDPEHGPEADLPDDAGIGGGQDAGLGEAHGHADEFGVLGRRGERAVVHAKRKTKDATRRGIFVFFMANHLTM